MKVFKLKIDLDDDSGLTFNALVDRPAHNKSLIAFNKKQETKLFFNDDKRMISGVAISANQLIYRFDENMGEYYVYFEPKEIEKMVLKMSRQQLLSSVNLMHDDRQIVNGITFLEGYFVSDSKRPPKDDENVQNGSYVMTYFVEDTELYNEIKNGKYVGYSVEGIFDQIPVNIKTNNKNQNQMKKSLFKLVFGEAKFAEANTTDGVTLMYEGDLAVGTAVFVVDADGNQISAPEGTHTLEDGSAIVVDGDGIVTEVIEPEAEEVPEDVAMSEVIAVFKELNDKFTALEEKFNSHMNEYEEFKKESVKPQEKFKKQPEVKTWRNSVKVK